MSFAPPSASAWGGPASRTRRARIIAVPPLFASLTLALLTLGTPDLSAQSTDSPWSWSWLGAHSLTGTDPVLATPYSVQPHPDPAVPLLYAALSGAVAPFGEDPALHSGSTVLELDRETGAVVRSFPVGYFPTELTVAPDGTELFVTTSTESTLFRIDLGTGAVTPIPLSDSLGGPIGYLSGIALDATGTRVIVTSNGGSFDGSSENVVVVDRASGAITARWTVAGAMNRLAIRGDGRVVLPVGFPGDDFTAAPVVQIIDMVNDQPVLAATLPLAVDTADFPQPSDVVLSPDGTRAYVTVFGGSADVFVIDVDAASLLPPLSLGGPEFAQSAVVASPDGAALAVADFFAGRLRVIARLSGAPVAEVPGLDLPNHVAVSSGRLVVSEQGQERISLVALTGSFLRADANGDTQVNLADGVAILNYLFAGGSLPCLAPADVDDDGVLDLADAISVFSYLFQGGTPPAAPFPYAGADPTAPVALDCP